MTRRARFSLAAIASVFLLVLLPLTASAKDASPTPPQGGSDAGEGYEIRGGRTQSVDPTAWNYVPPATGGGISPMSATGAQIISPFSVTLKGVTIAVPSGYLTHKIEGSGLTINKETAVYQPSLGAGGVWGVNICNWRIDFQNRDLRNISSTSIGTTHASCDVIGVSRTKSTTVTVKQGVQCARLYVNGTFRGEQCHSVFP